jgi:predicted SprT family Zn-dependent metalloprotease
MVKTAKELVEIFSKLPPDELVWAYWFAKDEIEIYNSPDGKSVEEDDWKAIVNDIGDPPDTLYEYYTEAQYRTLSKYRCDQCYEYDYTTIDSDSENLCKDCGEEADVVVT